jgi:riboflavin kinase/FMN adenylyltransferase
VRVIRGLRDVRLRRPVCLAIGVFDGVHLGHQAVISAAVRMSASGRPAPAVMTFDPHPDAVLSAGAAAVLLTTTDEKVRLLAGLGIKVAVIAEFDRGLAETSAEDFVRELVVEKLRAQCLVVGEGWLFGAGGRGTPVLLRRLGEAMGFRVAVVPPVKVGGRIVSSTRVRRLLERGKVEEARECLGRPYQVAGEVVAGEGRGRQLGYPTANVDPPSGKLVPAHGVYACLAGVRRLRPAVTNIGVRPTFGSGGRPRVEVHLLAPVRKPRLLGRRLHVEFIAGLRGERRFLSPDALKRQMARDCEAARRVLGALHRSGDVI